MTYDLVKIIAVLLCYIAQTESKRAVGEYRYHAVYNYAPHVTVNNNYKKIITQTLDGVNFLFGVARSSVNVPVFILQTDMSRVLALSRSL